MKAMTFMVSLSIIMAMAACASGSTVENQSTIVPADKNDISGIDWYLVEIINGNNYIKLDRSQLDAEGNGDVYSIQFDRENHVSGKAAPNRYNGPVKWGSGLNLSFGAMASTMMFAFKEPDALKEHDFFTYLTKVNSWGLTSTGRLELYCADASGRAVLIFEKLP